MYPAKYLHSKYSKMIFSLFEKIYTQLNKQFSIGFIPFLLEEVAIKSGYMQNDGIHPNEEGHQIMAKLVIDSLKPLLSK